MLECVAFAECFASWGSSMHDQLPFSPLLSPPLITASLLLSIAFAECFVSWGSAMHHQLPMTIASLASKAVNDKKFLCNLANTALDAAVDHCTRPGHRLQVSPPHIYYLFSIIL